LKLNLPNKLNRKKKKEFVKKKEKEERMQRRDLKYTERCQAPRHKEGLGND
jgi:hypothetical protein